MDQKDFNVGNVKEVLEYANAAEGDAYAHNDNEVKRKLGEMFKTYLRATPEAYRRDDPQDSVWRTAMYGVLRSIPKEQEYELGLGSEFYHHLNWLPGATVTPDGKLSFHRSCSQHTRDILSAFHEVYPSLEHINIAEVIGSRSKREKMGKERREVYLVLVKVKTAEGERIHFLRKTKYDDQYFISESCSPEEAHRKNREYMNYTLDRCAATQKLGVEIPDHRIFEATTIVDGRQLRTGFYDREYVHGPATDKLSPDLFGDYEFASKFEGLMGRHAAHNIVLGRVLFDDGDEIVLGGRKPDRIVLADPTGSFKELEKSLEDNVDVYASHIARTMFKARLMGVPAERVAQLSQAFYSAFTDEFKSIQGGYRRDKGEYDSFFDKRFREGGREAPGELERDIRPQWKRVLERLDESNSEAIVDRMTEQTTRMFNVMNTAVSGLQSGPEIKMAADELNQFFSTHPKRVDAFAEILREDESFKQNSARERMRKIAALRVTYLAREYKTGWDELEDYALDCRRRSVDDSSAARLFEETSKDKFNGLQLTGTDARLVLETARDHRLKSQLIADGYVIV